MLLILWLENTAHHTWKPGKDKLEAASYRPIAITSICSKIMAHVIYSQTMEHLEQHDILSKLQHGYQHVYSTGTQLWVIDLFAQGLENQSQVDCISLGFARTFDVVPHQRLLLKMNHYGIRNILPWIRHFITEEKWSWNVQQSKNS